MSRFRAGSGPPADGGSLPSCVANAGTEERSGQRAASCGMEGRRLMGGRIRSTGSASGRWVEEVPVKVRQTTSGTDV